MQAIRNQKGFTLIETLIAASILLFTALLTLSLFVHGYNHTATSGRMTNAMNVARSQIELIRSTPFPDVPTAFPGNEDEPATVASLPQGQWVVSYPEGTTGELLAVRLKVQWTEDNTPHEVVLDTLIANAEL